ncbi:S-layer homology domain-containing protein [Robertmurraya andreesenii]|uniref:SLH domain-containing protein n=1 Tax=Anoxybacillus andreesenii TaxID=1325932 RepID=A0ABT9V9N9_9BACL|nr:S-layer homology domain-containing protein [Robertmurraya andreesenii]MDQ0157678.1 hypothetical protein [Robertmurraya andreesenii]
MIGRMKYMTTLGFFIIVFMANGIFVQASSFKDIEKLADKIQQEVLDLTNRGMIKGTSPTTFSPDAPITRGQVVVMMGRYIEKNGIAVVDKYWERTDRFIDVPTDLKDRELLKYSTLLHDIGIFKGYNLRLYPNKPITREEMALTLERLMVLVREYSLVDYAYDLKSHVVDLQKASEEARPYIEALNALGISDVRIFQIEK